MPTNNPEESKRYREKHKVDLKKRKHAEYLKHADVYKARAKRNRQTELSTSEGSTRHHERKKKTDRKFRSTPHRNAWKAQYMRKYRSEHRAQFAEYERRRTALKYGVTYEKVDYLAIYNASPRCFYCGEPLNLNETQFDHAIPLNRGGSHTAENIRVSCASCNLSKHDKTPEEYEIYKLTGMVEPGRHTFSPPSPVLK